MKKLKKNLTIDWHSSKWWISLLSVLFLLVQEVLKLFGVDVSDAVKGQYMDIVNTLVSLGAILGIIYDTSNSKEKLNDTNNR